MMKAGAPLFCFLIVCVGAMQPARAFPAAASHPAVANRTSEAFAQERSSFVNLAQAPSPREDGLSIGRIVALRGSAQAVRNGVVLPLKVEDPVFRNDTLKTGSGSLAVTLSDATTLTLSANSQMALHDFVYRQGAPNNSATFEFASGVIAFAASQVAKSGQMKIVTPTATMGIRGTTGIVNLPRDIVSGETKIKLYPDADGSVGRIEIYNTEGLAVGVLAQSGSAYAIRLDGFSLQSGRPRYRAAAATVSARESARDEALLRSLHSSQSRGRRLINPAR